MPYKLLEDLPPSIQMHLPLHAQEIYRGAFNSAWMSYSDLSPAQKEEAAHRVAWAAVKRSYHKEGTQWVRTEGKGDF
ncbi:ChaB family protein [Bradyrhizobium sp. SYSU BS000235]|uniref:ChaB family protein n=1 Tax=Bradyrhizobium sp. SYSU BS000235 TaxID=3411332 RepID=UPI003C79552E